jgi:osmotically-inducible protein OsmY
MRKLLGLLLFSMVFSLIITGCSKNSRNQNAGMSDSDLKNRINAALSQDPELQAAKLDVDADMDNNEVTLSGKVSSEDLRSRAVEIARNTHPGLNVNDKIDVVPNEMARAENQGNTGNQSNMSDSDLKNQIKSALDQDPELKAADLGVSADVKKNSAKISGTVNSEQLRKRAINTAQNAMPGLTVEDKIDVKPNATPHSGYNSGTGTSGSGNYDQGNQNTQPSGTTPGR